MKSTAMRARCLSFFYLQTPCYQTSSPTPWLAVSTSLLCLRCSRRRSLSGELLFSAPRSPTPSSSQIGSDPIFSRTAHPLPHLYSLLDLRPSYQSPQCRPLPGYSVAPPLLAILLLPFFYLSISQMVLTKLNPLH